MMAGTLGVIGGTLVGSGGGGGASDLPSMLRLVGSSQAGTTVAASATPNTKGAWVEMPYAVAADANLLVLNCSNAQNGIANGALIDVGYGSAGAEVIIASDIAVGQHSTYSFPIPVNLPAGYFKVRSQSVVASRTMSVSFAAYDQPGLVSADEVVGLGTFPATSTATVMSNGNWVEIVAAAAEAYRYLVLIPSANQAITTSSGTLELGIGAAGAEVAFPGTIVYSGSTNEIIASRSSAGPALLSVFPGCAAGDRIAAKVTGGPNHASLIGVPY